MKNRTLEAPASCSAFFTFSFEIGHSGVVSDKLPPSVRSFALNCAVLDQVVGNSRQTFRAFNAAEPSFLSRYRIQATDKL